MRSRLYYIIIFCFSLTSCIKEKEDTPTYPVYNAYIRSTVIDSITGLPLSNAKVGFVTQPNVELPYNPVTSHTNGKYNVCESWGGDPRMLDGRPSDSTDLYIGAYTNNRYGYIKFKAAKLIVNDTITIPNTYLIPFGYVKAHIKDTTGTSIFDMNINYTNLIYVPLTIFWNQNGHIVDTTITWKAYSNSNVTINCLYSKFSIGHTDTYNIHVNEGDTSSVNLFY